MQSKSLMYIHRKKNKLGKIFFSSSLSSVSLMAPSNVSSHHNYIKCTLLFAIQFSQLENFFSSSFNSYIYS